MSLKSPPNQASSPTKVYSPLEGEEMKTGKYLGQIHRPKGFASRRCVLIASNCVFDFFKEPAEIPEDAF